MRRRIALAVVALHGLVLWLLLAAHRAHREEEEPPIPPQFVSAWIQAIPQSAQQSAQSAAAPLPPTTAAPRPIVTPRKPPVPLPATPPIAVPSPPLPETPVAPPAAPAPSVDWANESLLSARQAAAAAAAATAKGDTFSPPPKIIGQACKPKPGSMEWKGGEDRTVGMATIFPYFRLGKRCVIVLVLPFCVLNKLPEANEHLLDDMHDPNRSQSSVPDPNVCD